MMARNDEKAGSPAFLFARAEPSFANGIDAGADFSRARGRTSPGSGR
jgi:hypothetical protein